MCPARGLVLVCESACEQYELEAAFRMVSDEDYVPSSIRRALDNAHSAGGGFITLGT
jgi:hypothetical protein